jgi:hypothetical protein
VGKRERVPESRWSARAASWAFACALLAQTEGFELVARFEHADD